MGVRGLQTFLERNVENGCEPIHISRLVEEYKRKNRNKPVVMAVDGTGCVRKLYSDLCWFLNGQWKEFFERLKQFLLDFDKLGIELVFFFDGTPAEGKRNTWIKRRLQNLDDVQNIFSQYLRDGYQPPYDQFQLPVGLVTTVRFALKYTFGCKVITSIGECDKEVINFAHKNKCIAILGQDSDYIISNVAPYLSIENLDLQSMKTVMYNSKAFAAQVGLRVDQLPLLACLRGNDFVTADMLRHFHGQISSRGSASSLFHLLPGLVSFIKTHPDPSNFQNARSISYDVFGTPDKARFLLESIEMYQPLDSKTVKYNVDGLSKLIEERHVNGENLADVYGLWNNREIDMSSSLEDPDAVRKMLPFALLYRPIRQRIYYLFKKSAGRDFGTVKEWCAYAGCKLPMPEYVEPLPFLLASGGSTSLKELWIGASKKLKWEAFLACFDCSFSYQLLIKVPLHFIVLCCVLNFMIQYSNIEEWEVDAFIAQGVMVHDCDVSFLKKINIDRVNARVVHLSSVFMRGVTCAIFVLGTCSYPFPITETLPWNFFDGKLFHRTYLRAQKKERFVDQGEKINFPLNLFRQLKEVIVANTKFAK